METKNNIQTQSTEPEAVNEPAEIPSEINQPDPEAERLRAENAELKAAIRLRNGKERISDLLSSANARSPDLLFAAIRDDLQFDDDGELLNAGALVAELKKRHPEQFGPARAAGSIDAGVGSRRAADHISPESLARMTPSQIQKLDWAEVRRVLSER